MTEFCVDPPAWYSTLPFLAISSNLDTQKQDIVRQRKRERQSERIREREREGGRERERQIPPQCLLILDLRINLLKVAYVVRNMFHKLLEMIIRPMQTNSSSVTLSHRFFHFHNFCIPITIDRNWLRNGHLFCYCHQHLVFRHSREETAEPPVDHREPQWRLGVEVGRICGCKRAA